MFDPRTGIIFFKFEIVVCSVLLKIYDQLNATLSFEEWKFSTAVPPEITQSYKIMLKRKQNKLTLKILSLGLPILIKYLMKNTLN